MNPLIIIFSLFLVVLLTVYAVSSDNTALYATLRGYDYSGIQVVELSAGETGLFGFDDLSRVIDVGFQNLKNKLDLSENITSDETLGFLKMYKQFIQSNQDYLEISKQLNPDPNKATLMTIFQIATETMTPTVNQLSASFEAVLGEISNQVQSLSALEYSVSGVSLLAYLLRRYYSRKIALNNSLIQELRTNFKLGLSEGSFPFEFVPNPVFINNRLILLLKDLATFNQNYDDLRALEVIKIINQPEYKVGLSPQEALLYSSLVSDTTKLNTAQTAFRTLLTDLSKGDITKVRGDLVKLSLGENQSKLSSVQKELVKLVGTKMPMYIKVLETMSALRTAVEADDFKKIDSSLLELAKTENLALLMTLASEYDSYLKMRGFREAQAYVISKVDKLLKLASNSEEFLTGTKELMNSGHMAFLDVGTKGKIYSKYGDYIILKLKIVQA